MCNAWSPSRETCVTGFRCRVEQANEWAVPGQKLGVAILLNLSHVFAVDVGIALIVTLSGAAPGFSSHVMESLLS